MRRSVRRAAPLLLLLATGCLVGPSDEGAPWVAAGTVLDAVTGEPAVGTAVSIQMYCYQPPDIFGGEGGWGWQSLGSDEIDPATGTFRVEVVGRDRCEDVRVCYGNSERFFLGNGPGFLRYLSYCAERLGEGLDVRLQPRGILWVHLRRTSGDDPTWIIVQVPTAGGRRLWPPIEPYFHLEIDAGKQLQVQWTIQRADGSLESGSGVVVGERFIQVHYTIEY